MSARPRDGEVDELPADAADHRSRRRVRLAPVSEVLGNRVARGQPVLPGAQCGECGCIWPTFWLDFDGGLDLARFHDGQFTDRAVQFR
jgi:hypothetical protein